MKPPGRRRLDQLLVDRGLAESRTKAQAFIIAGQVLVAGQKAEKPGHTAPVDSRIELLAQQRYVGRGGLKLEAALEHFGIDVKDRVCADIGSSTGGFTDCLLQHGARCVYAVDVGSGQLDWKLRGDPRVRVREGINARYLRCEDIGEPLDFVSFDVSFISVTLVVPAVLPVLADIGEMVILVKPQFEVGRGEVGKGGIVRDPQLHAQACERAGSFMESAGYKTSLMESPILGAEGNREFLLYARH
jgi:23S rRNA (cytidine1920-2'-O)/16S rRNA (cytidine1409-2'-O)-methyltransferase